MYKTIDKHTEFVSYLRNSMISAENEHIPSIMLDNDDSQNEVDQAFVFELEKMFDDIFGVLD